MKILNRHLLVSLCVAGLFGSTAVFAATTNVLVSATVKGVCMFNTSGDISFVLDPSTDVNAVATVNTAPEFWCTKGTTYSFTVGDGSNFDGLNRRMKHDTLAEYIPYTFTATGGVGSGRATPITMNITADVANADFINASEGLYSDTLTVTITP